MADSLKRILLELIQRLDSISDEFKVITDSAVRDRMSDFIRDFYLTPVGPLPKAYDFATGSAVVNDFLVEALSAYIVEARRISDERKLSVQDRLTAFQDDEVTNDQGRSYDEYFGYWRPGSFANQ